MDMITAKSKRNDMDNIDYINLPRCLTIHMRYVTETVDSIDCEQSLIFLCKVTARERQARRRVASRDKRGLVWSQSVFVTYNGLVCKRAG